MDEPLCLPAVVVVSEPHTHAACVGVELPTVAALSAAGCRLIALFDHSFSFASNNITQLEPSIDLWGRGVKVSLKVLTISIDYYIVFA